MLHDTSIRREDPIWEADDGVEIEPAEQLFLDPRADAVAEERAIRDDDAGARVAAAILAAGDRSILLREASARGAPKTPHDDLEEKERGLGGLLVLGKIALDAALLLAAERRIGDDDIHAILLADLCELVAERVAGVDLRGVEA